MIEQIQGAGLSGMTGKSTKHGKNSLFAKLLAMLEKNAELSGKGKGLQLDEGKLSKGKGSLTDKLDPLALAKAKHLLGLAAKKKEEQKDKVNDEAASLLVAHVIVDQQATVKKTLGQNSKEPVFIAGQFGDQLSTKVDAKVGVGVVAQGSDKISQQMAKNIAEAGVDKSLLNNAADKVVQENIVQDKPAQNKLGGMAQVATGKAVDLLAAQPKGTLMQQQQGVVNADMGGQKNTLLSEQGAKPLQLAQATEAGVSSNAAQAQMTTAQTAAAQTEVSKSALEAQKAALAGLSNQSVGEKKDAKAGAESINAAALFQQAKANQSQQAQQSSSAALTSAQVNIADASLSGSGSQFSDNKGGQDARLLEAAMADVKSTGSSSVNSNFKNYLTNKTAPVMTTFDSMNYIAQSVKNGQTRLEIQLDPANLGKIQISLQSDASKQLQVHIIVDQSMTRAALEQQLPQLRSALAQQGFDLSGFSMDSRNQQASSGGEGNHGQRSHTFEDQADMVMGEMPVRGSEQFKTGSGLSIRV